MDFCERCGSVILLKEGKAVCVACGHKQKKKLKIKSSEKIGAKEGIAVIKQQDEVNPIDDMKCPKCKNKQCYFWTQQTRASDESETKFYKCVKCGHIWRVYR